MTTHKNIARHYQKFTLTPFLVLSGCWSKQYCSNSKPGLVANKEMSILVQARDKCCLGHKSH